MMDNFNKRASKVCEAIFLDDPGLANLCLSMLKQLFSVAEDSSGQARYNPVKLCKNGMRGVADNEFDAEDEPAPDNRTTITSEEAMKLCNKPFGGRGQAHVMAVLKRTITVIAGNHAVYIRFPSKETDATMHRVAFDEFAKEWLQEKNKKYYGLYKRGVESYPEDYDEHLDKEQEFVDAAIADRGTAKPEDFVRTCDERLQDKLKEMAVRAVATSVLPVRPKKMQCLLHEGPMVLRTSPLQESISSRRWRRARCRRHSYSLRPRRMQRLSHGGPMVLGTSPLQESVEQPPLCEVVSKSLGGSSAGWTVRERPCKSRRRTVKGWGARVHRHMGAQRTTRLRALECYLAMTVRRGRPR
jgi:hypothetical protein